LILIGFRSIYLEGISIRKGSGRIEIEGRRVDEIGLGLLRVEVVVIDQNVGIE